MRVHMVSVSSHLVNFKSFQRLSVVTRLLLTAMTKQSKHYRCFSFPVMHFVPVIEIKWMWHNWDSSWKTNNDTQQNQSRLALALSIFIPWTCCCGHGSWDVPQHWRCPSRTRNTENRRMPEEASGIHRLNQRAYVIINRNSPLRNAHN